MARLCDDASSDRLDSSTTQVTVPPFTLATWFYTDDATIFQAIMGIFDQSVSNQQQRLQYRGDLSGQLQALSFGTGDTSASTSTFAIANVWNHACAVYTSNSSRAVFLNGGGKGTDATSSSVSGLDRVTMAITGDTTPAIPFSGRLAAPAIWNVALTDSEVSMLAAGFSPLLVRPQSLVNFWELYGRESPEPDRISGNNFTVTGATQEEHAPLILPPAQSLIFPVPASVTSASLLLMQQSFRQ